MKNTLQILILGLVILASCTQLESTNELKTKIESSSTVNETIKYQLKDTIVQLLWREMKYDSALNDTFNSISINQNYFSSITAPEKAALGYVATFIGSECWWDGETNDDRTNLDCKIITALGLGYQCSDEHLLFLRKWFSTDKEVLSKLETSNCPTTPYTATSQNTFDEIKLIIQNDSIIVSYKASGLNMREQESWEWSEIDYFKLTNNNLTLVKKDKSELTREKFDMTEEEY